MKKVTLIVLLVFFASCGTYFNQPIVKENARLGESTSVSKALASLPKPQEKIVVGVYNFRDQTGQFKPTENGSTFSTAVTQGGTTMLLKALEDSKWFVPLERENINNLLNERNIIETTRNQYSKLSGTKPQPLKPLLFAGILLEGGIISYDTNIVTGGLGARYFGIGGSTQYRQDRVTVYLRAVSTSTGEILKTVYVSKTILSQALDGSFFRFIKFQRLLEAETGFTKNEPAQLAISEAIEKSVQSLVIEGIQDGLWSNKPEDEQIYKELAQNYIQEKKEAIDTDLYDRFFKERRGKSGLGIGAGVALMDGDLPMPTPRISGRLGYDFFITPHLNINASTDFFRLKNNNSFERDFASLNLNLQYTVLPFDKLTPLIYAGSGVLSDFGSRTDIKIQYGLGVEYLLAPGLGFEIFAEQNITFNDELDEAISGKRDDYYFNFGAGLTFYLSPPDSKNRKKRLGRKNSKEEKKSRKLNKKIDSNKE